MHHFHQNRLFRKEKSVGFLKLITELVSRCQHFPYLSKIRYTIILMMVLVSWLHQNTHSHFGAAFHGSHRQASLYYLLNCWIKSNIDLFSYVIVSLYKSWITGWTCFMRTQFGRSITSWYYHNRKYLSIWLKFCTSKRTMYFLSIIGKIKFMGYNSNQTNYGADFIK